MTTILDWELNFSKKSINELNEISNSIKNLMKHKIFKENYPELLTVKLIAQLALNKIKYDNKHTDIKP